MDIRLYVFRCAVVLRILPKRERRWRGEGSPRQRILRPVEWVFLLVIAVVGIDGREYWSGCQPMTTCLSV